MGELGWLIMPRGVLLFDHTYGVTKCGDQSVENLRLLFCCDFDEFDC